MKTLHANKDYVLHNGQAYITSDEEIKEGDWLVYVDELIRCYHKIGEHIYYVSNSGTLATDSQYCKKIIASTDKSLPVKHIDRSVFVSPVDVEGMADKEAKHFYISSQVQEVAKIWFKIGYNANPNQFTELELRASMHAAVMNLDGNPSYVSADKFIDDFIANLRPMSLPETIQCDDNYENLKPIWK